MSKREELARYLENQAYHCRMIADKLRAGEDVSEDYWLIDLFSSEEWQAEIAAIEGQEELHYELDQAAGREVKTA